jgi:hypothetical protein
VALGFGLAGWAPFFCLHLPAREHYAHAIGPALAVLAALGLERVARLAGPRAARALAALVLATVALAGVVETRAVLAAIDSGAAEPGSDYDLPYRDKLGAAQIVLDHELELHRDRRFEERLALEECWRELARRDPARAARFVPVALHQTYWELDYTVPCPREPRGQADLVAAPGPELVPGEIGRSGSLVVTLVAR